jgi:hypothetical protein
MSLPTESKPIWTEYLIIFTLLILTILIGFLVFGQEMFNTNPKSVSLKSKQGVPSIITVTQSNVRLAHP